MTTLLIIVGLFHLLSFLASIWGAFEIGHIAGRTVGAIIGRKDDE